MLEDSALLWEKKKILRILRFKSLLNIAFILNMIGQYAVHQCYDAMADLRVLYFKISEPPPHPPPPPSSAH